MSKHRYYCAMKLEQAIKQKRPFANESEKALVNLLFTQNHIVTEMAAFFKPHGLTNKQYNILRILRGAKDPISTSEIRARMLDRMSDVSRIVDRLEIKKLVTKSSCSKDKRKVDVSITEDGMKILKKLDNPVSKLSKEIIPLTDTEIKTLNKLLNKLRSN